MLSLFLCDRYHKNKHHCLTWGLFLVFFASTSFDSMTHANISTEYKTFCIVVLFQLKSSSLLAAQLGMSQQSLG